MSLAKLTVYSRVLVSLAFIFWVFPSAAVMVLVASARMVHAPSRGTRP